MRAGGEELETRPVAPDHGCHVPGERDRRVPDRDETLRIGRQVDPQWLLAGEGAQVVHDLERRAHHRWPTERIALHSPHSAMATHQGHDGLHVVDCRELKGLVVRVTVQRDQALDPVRAGN